MAEKTDSDVSNKCTDDTSAAQCKRDNQEAIAGYNADVDKNGVFGDSWCGRLLDEGAKL